MQIKLKKNNKIEHQGIRIEFIGQIGLFISLRSKRKKSLEIIFFLEIINDRSASYEFNNQSKTLSMPGELTENASLDFSFPNMEKPHESYFGTNVKLR